MNALETQIYKACRQADERYQEDGETSTKTWIRDYFLPALEDYELVILSKESRKILESNAKAMAHVADTHRAEEDRLREYVHTLEVRIVRTLNLLGSELEEEDIITLAHQELLLGLPSNAKVLEDDADLTLPEDGPQENA